MIATHSEERLQSMFTLSNISLPVQEQLGQNFLYDRENFSVHIAPRGDEWWRKLNY